MTALDIAGAVKEYGGWGLSAVLMVALVVLYKDSRALLEKTIEALGEAAKGADSTKDALNELRSLIGTSGKAVGDQGQQIAVLVERITHGFGNTTAALDGIARRLEYQPLRDDRRLP